MAKVKKKQTRWQDCRKMGGNDSGGCIYVLGFIGSLIYYLSTATGFWNGVLGVLKAIVWPVFIVMKILGM